MEATIRVLDTRGLSAPTAAIAKEAGISNGSLFTYFPTKTDLFNQVYIEIKKGMIAEITNGLPEGEDFCELLFHSWLNRMEGAISKPPFFVSRPCYSTIRTTHRLHCANAYLPSPNATGAE